jgi:sec-independent protein translocase protein TatA
MRLFGLGPTELMIILAIILLLFGPKQIPKLSRMFGKAVKDVREGLEGKDDEEEALPEATAAKTEASAEESKKPEDAAV